MTRDSWDAVVVGAGPNGLAAAITLAQADRSVLVLEQATTLGGGLRSDEIVPGLVRDRCAAVMPFAVGSPYLRSLPLDEHGLEWIHPEIPFTHPLDDGRVGVAHRTLDATVDELGIDGRAYRRLVGPTVGHWDRIAIDLMAPVAHVPRAPLTLAKFIRTGARSARKLSKFFASEEAKGLLAGTAAHSVLPLDKSFTGAFAMLFCASAHARGWPVVRGGSQQLADAMVSLARDAGVTFESDSMIRSLEQLPAHDAALFDVDPTQLLDIAGDALPTAYRKKLAGFSFGPGICKVDHVLAGPVPWLDPASSLAGTVHVGGTFAEVQEAEAQVAAGEHPEQPFVLVAQQSLVDSTRTPDGRHVLWSYCHVPNGSTIDMSAPIETQIERFAPGFRDLILERRVTTTPELQRSNPNYVGGDIGGGSLSLRQMIARPRTFAPYSTPNPSIFLCSASTPPGGGVHGMAGHNAALAALRSRLR